MQLVSQSAIFYLLDSCVSIATYLTIGRYQRIRSCDISLSDRREINKQRRWTYAPRFRSIFLDLSFSLFDSESEPSHLPLSLKGANASRYTLLTYFSSLQTPETLP